MSLQSCITVWHWPHQERWYDEGIKRTLKLVKEAGFTHINWNPDSGSSYWLSKAEIEFTAGIVRDAGLKMHSVHSSNGRNPVHEFRSAPVRETRKDIGSPNEWQRRSGVELLQNRIDLAHAFGAPNVVLHIDVTDDVFRSARSEKAFFEPFWKSLDELEQYSRKKNVKIAVETLFCAGAKAFLSLYDRLFHRYSRDYIGLCYDSGHWEIVEPGALSVLKKFGDRLIATHIHDNYGATDDHFLPFDGRLNWEAITEAIAKTPYVTPLNFETPMDRYELPEGSFYTRAWSVAQRLEAMVQDARAKLHSAAARVKKK